MIMSKKDDKISKAEEPNTAYEINSTSENETELHPVLVQLLEKSIKDIEKGNGISNEEMQRRIKLKYPFLK